MSVLFKFVLLLFFSFFVILVGNSSSFGKVESDSTNQSLYLTLSPYEVPTGSGRGTVQVKWQTTDGSAGQLFVVTNGQPETFLAKGEAGHIDFIYIFPKNTYEFRLYSESEPRTLLATATPVISDKIDYSLDLGPIYTKAFGIRILPLLLPAAIIFFGIVFLRKKKYEHAKMLFYASVFVLSAIAIGQVVRAKPVPLKEQVFPDSHEYADAARQIAEGNGYVTYVHNNERLPPRYPPGYSIALAPFHWFVGEYPKGIQIGAKFYVALYILVAIVAAWTIYGDWLAAALTALFILVSPFAETFSPLIMSDPLAAGLLVAIVALLHKPSDKSVVLAGLLLGSVVSIRLQFVILFPILIIFLPMKKRIKFTVAAFPFFIALATYNWFTFGSPLKTGYAIAHKDINQFSWFHAITSPMQGDGPWIVGDTLEGWLLRWICPCNTGGPQAQMRSIFFYPSLLLGFFWVYAPPFITGFGIVSAWRRRSDVTAKTTLLITLAIFIFFVFYFYQATRFMAAPATLLLIYATQMFSGWIKYCFGMNSFNQSAEDQLD